jgi:hypothetical protein
MEEASSATMGSSGAAVVGTSFEHQIGCGRGEGGGEEPSSTTPQQQPSTG